MLIIFKEDIKNLLSSISGDVLGQAGGAAIQGLKNLADPTKLAKKVITKTITKGKDIPGTDR